MKNLPKPPSSLVNALKEGRAIAIVGSGLTTGAGGPSWAELLNGLAAEAAETRPDQFKDVAVALQSIRDGKFLDSASLLRSILGPEFRAGIVRQIETCRSITIDHDAVTSAVHDGTTGNLFQELGEIKPRPLSPGKAHLILKQLGFRAFISTNYDRLLETATPASIADIAVYSRSYRHLAGLIRGSRRFILKLHGDISHQEDIVLAREDYAEIRNDQTLRESLRGLLQTSTPFWIGYGHSDPDLDLLMEELKEKLGLGGGFSLAKASDRLMINRLKLADIFPSLIESYEDIPDYLLSLAGATGTQIVIVVIIERPWSDFDNAKAEAIYFAHNLSKHVDSKFSLKSVSRSSIRLVLEASAMAIHRLGELLRKGDPALMKLLKNSRVREIDGVEIELDETTSTPSPLVADSLRASSSYIVGIDLGTTSSVLAVMEGTEAKIIPNSGGAYTTPSVVAFTQGGERLVGQVAKRQAVTNPHNTVYSIKRFMGRRYDEVTEEMKMVPYEVEKADSGGVRIKALGKTYSPPEISAMVLQKLKQAAEDHLGEKVDEAVITVPAYFNAAQRQATKDAGRIAGLNVRRLVNEPTAAALAYGLDKKADQKIAVYDFGGGTFDISILDVGDGVVEVKSTNGDTHLGGDNVDQLIIDWLLAEFKKDQGIDLSQDAMAIQRLKAAAEEAKISLSSTQETEIILPFITTDASGSKDLNLRLSRSTLEQLVSGLIERSFGLCRQALQDAGLTAMDIDQVVLVGGQTHMPYIQKRVTEFFGKEPHKGVNPDEVVGIGAAIQGGVLRGDVKDVLLLDVTPLSLGIETLGGVMTTLIPRNTTIPTQKSETFSTASDNQTSVEVHVLQGERPMARDNRTLGRFHLVGIPSAPRGVPQVEVAFDIDANGIVNVSAKDKGTGKEQRITITSSSGLNDAEIKRMVKDAESHTSEDAERRKTVETRNQLESLVYQTEKSVEEHKDKLSAADKGELGTATAVAKKALESGDQATIELAQQRLLKASQKLAEAVYQQLGAEAGETKDTSIGDKTPSESEAATIGTQRPMGR